MLPSAAQRRAEPAAVSRTPASPDTWGSRGLTGRSTAEGSCEATAGAREGPGQALGSEGL